MNGIHFAHGHYVTWSPKVIPFLAIKISHESTLGADKMVMAVDVYIKPRFLTERSHARDEPLLFEQSKCSVNGVELYNGDPFAHSSIDRLRIRMLIRARKLTVDLSPLVCCLDTITSANSREYPGSPVNFFRFNLHKWTK